MKDAKEQYTLSSTTESELENDQWFPKTPAKPSSKWSIIIALLDEIIIIIFVLVIIYIVIDRI